ncbi:MAG: ubiquinone/menaquinone biosynthesis methyltransferase [Verrucomicrobia bacterium]|nr:ubiquinone/menaquinone biosynthesis methyltransferase [Verrucomicrobiota bacterium]
MNRYFRTGDDRAQGVAELFNRIAPRYDLINDLQSFGMHRWWKHELIDLCEIKPGETAVDLCCGTGDVAFRLAQRGATVTGLDFSSSMLDVARRRQQGVGKEVNIAWREGDAMNTGLPGKSFDVVTISYGLRNLSSWEVGLAEMLRLARPGARLAVLDFGKPDFGPWRSAYFGYLRFVVPVFGRLFCGDADTHGYIHPSLEAYPAQRGVDARMRELGLEHCRIVNLLGGVMSINLARVPRLIA